MVEVVIPAGMVAWHGGDSAPADIGEAAQVLHADGTIGLANRRSILWGRPKKETGASTDWERLGPRLESKWIIAYTPRADAKVSERERVARIEMAREAAAKVFDADEQPALAADIRAGRQDHMSQVQAAMNAILATLRAGEEVERLREALEPFADALGEDDGDEPDHTSATLVCGRSTDYSLDLGDFRAARAALAPAAGGEGL